jgi:hypothetical protein
MNKIEYSFPVGAAAAGASSRLNELLDSAKKEGDAIHLAIADFNEAALVSFLAFIRESRSPLPFKKLSLSINPSVLGQADFLELIKAINTQGGCTLELDFPPAEVETAASVEAIQTHLTAIAREAAYPIKVLPASLEKEDFRNTIIGNIRRKYREAPTSADTARGEASGKEYAGKTIKLKGLIKNKALIEAAQYARLEVQHVEAIEAEVAHQVVAEAQVESEVEAVQGYVGDLIGYTQFATPQYKSMTLRATGIDESLNDALYALLESELFANLPHAIKYLSPKAAEQLARHLPGWVTLNKDNLPQGFLLKKTSVGEWVLDYDPFSISEKNKFTPTQPPYAVELEPLYNMELKPSDLARCGITAPLTEYHKKLVNIWIKYGDEGLRSFAQKLTENTRNNPAVLSFMVEHYLAYFPQWDHLSTQPDFFDSLKSMSHYEPTKLECLKRFLANTGSSRYDLKDTIDAFELFWAELSSLCDAQKVDISRINKSTWSTPKGGNPQVYMERMLCLLRQARTLDEQLNELDEIVLDNYGAYYASRYEGFKLVSKCMKLTYDAKGWNRQPFNPNARLYKSSLVSLYYMRSYPFLSYGSGYYACFRFIGQQTTGITLTSLRQQLSDYDGSDSNRTRETSRDALFYSLFFASHERFKGRPLNDLFKNVGYLKNSAEGHTLVHSTIKKFLELYRSDIKFNEIQGLAILSEIAAMNSHEFESGWGISKIRALDAIFAYAAMNKLAVFKYMEFNAYDPRFMILAIDAANLLRQDPLVADVYADDLLLFAGLVSNRLDEIYYIRDFPKKKPVLRETRDLDELPELPTEEEVERRHLPETDHTGEETEPLPDPKVEAAKALLETIRGYLHKAAEMPKPNNLQYGIQLFLDKRGRASSEAIIRWFENLERIGAAFNPSEVKRVFEESFGRFHSLVAFSPGYQLSHLLYEEMEDSKEVLIKFIVSLEQFAAEKGRGDRPDDKRFQTLSKLKVEELTTRLREIWSSEGALFRIEKPELFGNTMQKLYKYAVKKAFGLPTSTGLLKSFAEKIGELPDFKEINDFDKLDLASESLQNIAACLKDILKNDHVKGNEAAFVTLIEGLALSQLDYKTLYAFLNLLRAMPIDYTNIVAFLIDYQKKGANNNHIQSVIGWLEQLQAQAFPVEYLETFAQLVAKNPVGTMKPAFVSALSEIYKTDPRDPVLAMLMTRSSLTYVQMEKIVYLSKACADSRNALAGLLSNLLEKRQLDTFLDTVIGDFSAIDIGSAQLGDPRQKILDIIIRSQAATSGLSDKVDYPEVVGKLSRLSTEDLTSLHEFYKKTRADLSCLAQALPIKGQSFAEFLINFEKTPFGQRDLKKQFSTIEVERVINESKDLLNGTPYTHQYRKQLMEAFLFVNAIGEHLPVYDGKPAKELSNEEIQAFFLKLKSSPKGDSPVARSLLALGLMREAMYRSTGQFPYSTQMIALIDGMMHEGHFVSNIDTGQGKSLIDVMKAAFLWVDSERVDLTTSSLVDAERDIANYGPFLKLLGIPYSESPISAASDMSVFKANGINFSTFAQLSLFFAKAEVSREGLPVLEEGKRVSLVINESDYSILDDSVIYRFAVPDDAGIGYGQEWIYYGINEFVTKPGYISTDSPSAQKDIDDLKEYLRATARRDSKPVALIDKFTDAQYYMLLESALMVNYVLKQDKDYVIPDTYEQRMVNGVRVSSKVVKVLMKDGKVSPDSTFGNGMQQLLYARLNKERGTTDFVIEPQHKTVVSSNNKNLLDYYRALKGFIWGSSGTVGSSEEMREQYAKYGFDFAKAEPHQQNRVKHHPPQFLDNEKSQFAMLVEQLLKGNAGVPRLVFCKDIATARRLHEALKQACMSKKSPLLQLYTGIGKEEEYIARAANPQMITITTAALGRNTDIPYDKIKGLHVWHTSVDSTRRAGQKSGRTGRQGSPGHVHYVLNKQDLGGKPVDEVRASIEKQGEVQRAHNEALYDMLGYLLSKVKRLPPERFQEGKNKRDFLMGAWSSFSAETENKYRESLPSTAAEQQSFVEKAVRQFNKLLEEHLKPPVSEQINAAELFDALTKKHERKREYFVDRTRVKLADCVPPITIAYHLVKGKVGSLSSVTVDDVKKQLKALFKNLNKGNFVAENSRYLQYLSASSASQAVMVKAHKEFLTEYLQESSKSAWLRCFGYGSKLSRLAGDPVYLLMFHSFARFATTVSPKAEAGTSAAASSAEANTLEMLPLIKGVVVNLLNNYLQSSWFISSERKQWASELKGEINQADTLEALVKAIITAQIATALSDIEKNKRVSKPQHLFGHSRYQETLSRALDLSMALGGGAGISKLTEKLTALLTGSSEALAITTDEVQNLVAKAPIDRRNAEVIGRSLKDALSGITGREKMTGKGREEPSGGSSTGGGDGGSEAGPRRR